MSRCTYIVVVAVIQHGDIGTPFSRGRQCSKSRIVSQRTGIVSVREPQKNVEAARAYWENLCPL